MFSSIFDNIYYVLKDIFYMKSNVPELSHFLVYSSKTSTWPFIAISYHLYFC